MARPLAIDLTQRHQVADRHRRDRRRRDRDQVLDRHDQPLGAHQHRARPAAGPVSHRRWAAPISPSAPATSATVTCDCCADDPERDFGADEEREFRALLEPGAPATATRRATRAPSRIARPRWRCRSARARSCSRWSASASSPRRSRATRWSSEIVAPLQRDGRADRAGARRAARPLPRQQRPRARRDRRLLADGQRRLLCRRGSGSWSACRPRTSSRTCGASTSQPSPVRDHLVGHVGDLDRRVRRQHRLAVGGVEHQEPVAGRLVGPVEAGLEVDGRCARPSARRGPRATCRRRGSSRGRGRTPPDRRTRRPRCSSRARCGPSSCRRRASSR